VIENFEDGVITKEKRDEKLKEIDEKIQPIHEKLIESSPTPAWTPAQLVELFAPFTSWASLDREAKRKVLNGLAPRFHVADYQISGIHLDSVDVTPDISGNFIIPCEPK
jgi:hypothetical protein